MEQRVSAQNAQNENSYYNDDIGGFIFRPDFDYEENKKVYLFSNYKRSVFFL